MGSSCTSVIAGRVSDLWEKGVPLNLMSVRKAVDQSRGGEFGRDHPCPTFIYACLVLSTGEMEEVVKK